MWRPRLQAKSNFKGNQNEVYMRWKSLQSPAKARMGGAGVLNDWCISFWTQNFRSHYNYLGHEIYYCRRSYERNMYTIVMWSLKIVGVELVSSRCRCNAPTELECETNCGWASYTQFGCKAKDIPPFQNRCTRECSLREHELNIVDVLVLPLKLSHSFVNSR